MSDVQLPAGWMRLPLGDAGTWLGGGTPSKSNPRFWRDGTVPWVSPKDMKTRVIHQSEDRITEDAVEQSSTKRVPAKSVLIVTRSGILEHSLPVALTAVDVTLNQDTKAIVPREGLDASYLAWALEAHEQAILNGCRKAGTTVASIETSVLQRFQVPMAPLPEQRRIVAALEEHLSELDVAVAGLERARANCANLRAAVLKATVDGSLLEGLRHRGVAVGPDSWSPSVPTDWSWRTVEELADLVEYGTSAKTGDDEQGVPVLRMGNIVDGALSWESLKFLPPAHEEFPRLLLRDGDLLFNRTNSPELVGKSAVFRERRRKASFASYLLRVRLREDMSPEFLAAYLNSRYGRAWVANVVSQQVGQANVNGSKLRALHVPVPPRETQNALVHALTRTLDGLDQTTTEVGRQLLRATRLRQSILKHAFEGKLVPQDPNDEPASVLIDRIRAERESNAPRAPKSRLKAKTARKAPRR